MRINNAHMKFCSACILISFATTCLISIFITSTPENCDCNRNTQQIKSDTVDASIELKPKLAILVPFRDRFDELLQFAPHMMKFLDRQAIPHHIFILNQVDRYRFNRASLINVGFLYTKQDYDYIAMHDVDLLPLNDQLHYDYPSDGPFHVAAPNLHPKYHYKTFVGGILLVKREHFELMNGMSNRYWGWGLEDDEFYVRIKDAHLPVKRPINITTGINDTFAHVHDRVHRKRDTAKCFNQREVTRKRDRETGLSTLKHRISRINNLRIDDIVNVTIVNIELICNHQETPWCDCSRDEMGKKIL
ncbi:beta-1,4-galactosyltransferase 7 [Sitodiplosis mosellana]|uniref:beta-1,4-galactosyltransferase 7 n=1 Tax=Sitodiplosis mosellana TaxID=263140 RepID=UPI002443A8F3|nr:beta-1,4-galactosyltransferase 7 [Sitodiplosis mosellana]